MKYVVEFSERIFRKKQEISVVREQIYDGLAQISIVDGGAETREKAQNTGKKRRKNRGKAQKNEKKSEDKNPKSSRKDPK